VVGEREEVLLSAEEGAMWSMRLVTCAREDNMLGYVRSRIESWRDSYFFERSEGDDSSRARVGL
jgi:hypothetical protein